MAEELFMMLIQGEGLSLVTGKKLKQFSFVQQTLFIGWNCLF